IVASSLPPIQSMHTPLPNDVGRHFTGSGNNSKLLSTIMDFTIAVDGNNQYRPMVVYTPIGRVPPNRHALCHESEQNRHHRGLEGHLW
ncbi:MAG: hypothetical protein ACKPKO_43055, partial [Candidatus Fonsibacter sp.]